MKPEIGTKVYCIYGDGILVDTVEFIGNNSFIIKSFGDSTYEDSWEWYYEDYEAKWFTNLTKATMKLCSRYIEEHGEESYFKVVKVSDEWYKIEEVEI